MRSKHLSQKTELLHPSPYSSNRQNQTHENTRKVSSPILSARKIQRMLPFFARTLQRFFFVLARVSEIWGRCKKCFSRVVLIGDLFTSYIEISTMVCLTLVANRARFLLSFRCASQPSENKQLASEFTSGSLEERNNLVKKVQILSLARTFTFCMSLPFPVEIRR